MAKEATGQSSVFEDSISAFLGNLKPYLDDDTVTEILVNGPHEIFIERRGVLERTPVKFSDEQALQAAVRNIAQFVGRRIDDDNPVLDARLPDGSRVAAVLPPCSRKGTTLSIRKFSKHTPTFVDLIQRGTISKDAARFLDVCVFLGKNMIVSGGTGSGKTTFLNVLGGRIPAHQRLIVIEDSSELKIKTEHCVFFETKPADVMGKGQVTIRELIRSALRLRPDRIVVGEVRGVEALDLITTMNTGHGGSMGTTHANSPIDALVRLETLAMMAEGQVPVGAVRRQIASAIQILVQIKRMSDGSRKVTHISEVQPTVSDSGLYGVTDIFVWDPKVRGMVATGNFPSFIEEIELNRLPFGREKFAAPQAA